MKSDAYFVEQADAGCERCCAGRTYAIVGPDGVGLGRTWDDADEAAVLAASLTEAFNLGKDSIRSETPASSNPEPSYSGNAGLGPQLPAPSPQSRNDAVSKVQRWCNMYHLNMPAPDVLAAFEKEMEGKQYGLEETWDAFCWFRDGWLAQHTALSETQAQESEDAARYRWFRDECSHDRRVEITEISGTPDMLEHHIDKGRCGL